MPENQSQTGDAEGPVKKYRYPFSVFFIISNEFCERFNYYGMRSMLCLTTCNAHLWVTSLLFILSSAILALYLTRKLDFSDDNATIIYHTFTTLVYFCCIFGAIIADSWWGKFHTILWLSIVYVSGSTVLTLGSVEPWNMPAKWVNL